MRDGHNIKIMAHKQRLHVITREAGRWRRHRDEMQERVRAEHDEDETEQRAGDDGGDFHFLIFGCRGSL